MKRLCKYVLASTFAIIVFVACNQVNMIPVNSIASVSEFQNITEITYKIKNLYSHFPDKVELDLKFSAPGMWDTTSSESCNRDIMSLLIVPNKNKADSTFINRPSVINYYFKKPGYCETMADLNEHIVPDLTEFNIPNEDLKVLFCESKPGDFWKKPNNCYRPECLGEWKHGYSKGIGVYDNQGTEMKVYWVYVW